MMNKIKKFSFQVNWFVFILIVWLLVVDASCVVKRTSNLSMTNTADKEMINSSFISSDLIQPNGKIIEPLADFLKLFKIKHEDSLESINEAMQVNFIRKPGLERWDLVDLEEDQQLRSQALSLLQTMGFVQATPTTALQVDYFLLFGATLSRIEKRFTDFLNQYQTGKLICKNVVLLGGVRYLQPAELDTLKKDHHFESFLKELNKVETLLTEADVWRFIWQTKANSALQEEFKESKDNLFFVNSTNITHGTNQRATTHTTLEAWLEDFKPTPGACHGNVEKPYGPRIKNNLEYVLAKKYYKNNPGAQRFKISWNSPAANEDTLLSVYKDELARCFYQEYMLKKELGILPVAATASKEEQK